MDQEREYTHESFGMARFSRQQGGHYTLFGSSVKHNNTIELTICNAVHKKSFGEDRYYARNEVVSVRFSPVQFADLISTLNAGNGVPCTIECISGDGKRREDCPSNTNAREDIQDFYKEIVDELHNKLKRLKTEIVAALDKPKLGKKDKEDILFDFDIFMEHFKSNLPFVLKQFNVRVNDTLSHAKGELDAAITNTIATLGIQKLKEICGENNNIIEVPLLEEQPQFEPSDETKELVKWQNSK